MTPSDRETDVVLLLDLADEHPIDEELVLMRVPDRASAKIYRLTDLEVDRCPTGTPDDWTPVIPKIAALVHKARETQRSGGRCRYWVAGRAGLPAFFHVGYLLSSRAKVTLVNQRKTGEIDELRFEPGSAASPASERRYFQRSAPPADTDRSGHRVGLLVTAGIPVPVDQAGAALSVRGTEVAVVLEAQAGDALDAGVLASAAGELDQMMAEVLRSYPDSKALAVFVAGPVTLAFLLGRAIPANLFHDVQVFDHRRGKYQFAYETSVRHKILFLASNPKDLTELELQREADEIRQELNRGRGDHFEIMPLWAAQGMDLLRELRERRPNILHFAGHGDLDGLYFQADDGSGRAVSSRALELVLEAAGASVELVVLNACDSAQQLAAVTKYVPAAVGMTGKISDAAARSFAVGFYGGLGEGEPLSTAFRHGQAAIAVGATRSAPARDVIASGRERPASEDELPRLAVREGIDPSQWVLVSRPRR